MVFVGAISKTPEMYTIVIVSFQNTSLLYIESSVFVLPCSLVRISAVFINWTGMCWDMI